MPKIKHSSVVRQYKSAANFAKRSQTHGVGKIKWYRGVFDRFKFPNECKILELGCGLGSLWSINQDRIPKAWDITLSDFSRGMLFATKKNLKSIKHLFKYKIINAEAIRYPDDSFDVVIANGLLYLVPNLKKTIKEIARVIKPGGILIASTSGKNYMIELVRLLEKTKLPVHRNYNKYSFSCDNGTALLTPYFSKVKLFRSKNKPTTYKEAKLLADHVLSTNLDLTTEQIKDVRNYFDDYFKKKKIFKMTIDTGIFVAKK
jgi:ubiquinone/menaquinone biosynthesis C-methylase UbiE